MQRFLTVLLLFVVWSAQAVALPIFEQPDVAPVEKVFKFKFDPAKDTQLTWEIEPGYYLYGHRTGIKLEDGQRISLEMPEGQAYSDEFFGDSTIYRHQLHIDLPSNLPEHYQVVWQGCADRGICYPPQSFSVSAIASENLAEDQSIAQRLANASLLTNVLLLFGMGVLLAFTPCTLPMIPILTTVISGNKSGGWSGARYGLAFVLPMAIIYAVLGVVAASLGKSLQAMLQQAWLLIPFAGLFVLLALAQFGLFRLQLPAFIRDKLSAVDSRQQGGKYFGAMMMGALSALLVGPCMTAPLAGVLLYIAQTGNALTGALALFALGIGTGTPLLFAIIFGSRWLPKPGTWMETVNQVFGFALLAAAIFVLRALLDDTLVLALWGAWLLAVALYTGKNKLAGRWQTIGQYIALLLGIWAAAILLGAASGGRDPLKPLQHLSAAQTFTATIANPYDHEKISNVSELKQRLAQAKAENKLAIVDFYADWCVSCKVMERDVFANPQVRDALANVEMLTFDVTQSTAEQSAYMKEMGIFAPPAILFLNSHGAEQRQLRITAEVNAKEFLQQLAQLQK